MAVRDLSSLSLTRRYNLRPPHMGKVRYSETRVTFRAKAQKGILLLLAKYLKQFRKIFFAGAQSVRRFDVEMIMAAGYPKEEWKRLYSERWGETI